MSVVFNKRGIASLFNFGDSTGILTGLLPGVDADYGLPIGIPSFLKAGPDVFKGIATAPFIDFDCRSIIHGCS